LPWRRCVRGHPKDKKRFGAITRNRTFTRNESGIQLSAALDQIRTEAVIEEWIDQQGPDRSAARVS
jgi:hypothetical protein